MTIRPHIYFTFLKDSINFGANVIFIPHRVVSNRGTAVVVPPHLKTMEEIQEYAKNIPPPPEFAVTHFGFSLALGFCAIEISLVLRYE